MQSAIDSLYRDGDAARAATIFRSVLAAHPGHYGATYQLAVALERSGDRAGARLAWQEVLILAERAETPPLQASPAPASPRIGDGLSAVGTRRPPLPA
jgi:hypothetical protein